MLISCVVRLAALRIGTADMGTNQNSMIAPATAAEPKPVAPSTTEPRKTAKNMRRLRESMVELVAPLAQSRNGAAKLPTMRRPCHLQGIACVMEIVRVDGGVASWSILEHNSIRLNRKCALASLVVAFSAEPEGCLLKAASRIDQRPSFLRVSASSCRLKTS
jgi:hypothetical protein